MPRAASDASIAPSQITMKRNWLTPFACAIVLGFAHMTHAASLTLAWNPNPETDVAGYLVYFGTQPGSYAAGVDVGKNTSQPVGDLVDGATYFFTVKAYNTSGMFSDSSQELAAAAPGGSVTPVPVPTTRKHILDLNGDHRGDAFLYNAATGDARFQLLTASAFTESVTTWDPGWQIHPANLNGDDYTDFFLYDPARGFWIQALNHGGDGTFTYTLGNWDSSWTVVPSDLDGDGLTDMFVYNFANGVWVKCFVDGSGGFKGYAAGNWDPGWTFYHRGPERRRPRRLLPLQPDDRRLGRGVQPGGLRHLRLPGVGAVGSGLAGHPGGSEWRWAHGSVPAECGGRACQRAEPRRWRLRLRRRAAVGAGLVGRLRAI